MIIDVRGPDEFDGPLGHIPGARNIVPSELLSEVQSLSAFKETPLVLVCETDKRSAKLRSFCAMPDSSRYLCCAVGWGAGSAVDIR